jgi:hypothetical protein
MQGGGIDTQRRQLLLGAVAATAALAVPWVRSRPGTDTGAAFARVSSYLLGRDGLDAALGHRLQQVLTEMFPNFPARLQVLAALLASGSVQPLELQALVDGAHPELAPWPRRIFRAWTVGVVGEGADARCVAYESALNAVLVADVLKPPTYAYGAYGSWSEPPRVAAERAHG